METLQKFNVSHIATRLNRPFSMINITSVGDILLSVYLCQGVLDWHKHIDNDELFWVHEGMILLESEWGNARLRPAEIALVPKGIGHRSGSAMRSIVLLLRCGLGAEKKNGRRRLYAMPGESKLKSINLIATAQALTIPFEFHPVAWIDESVMRVAWGEGVWPLPNQAPHDRLFFVLGGEATVRSTGSMLHLHGGEFTVLPGGTAAQLSTTQGTVLVLLTREEM